MLWEHYNYCQPVEHELGDGKTKFYALPFADSLQSVLKITEMRDHIMNSSHASQFFKSPYFNDKLKSLAEFAIYIAMYMDEFEVANPLGPARKTHKLEAVYYRILTLELPTYF